MAEGVFTQERKGNLRAQLGVDDPSSPGNALSSLWSTISGALRDTLGAPAPIPRRVMDESGREAVQMPSPDPEHRGQTQWTTVENPGQAPQTWSDYLAGLGSLAQDTVMHRGGFGPYKVGGRAALRSSQEALKQGRETAKSLEGAQEYFKRVTSPSTSWFHGTGGDPRVIAQEGLRGNMGYPPIMGEPYGVSMTPLAGVSEGFGGEAILRVHPNLHPDEILQLYDPSQNALYKGALRKSIEPLDRAMVRSPDPKVGMVPYPQLINDIAQGKISLGGPGSFGTPAGQLAEHARLNLTTGIRSQVAENLTNELKRAGFRGLLYPPQRYGEYELRHMDPDAIRILEWRKGQTSNIQGAKEGRLPMERMSSAQTPVWEAARPIFTPEGQVRKLLSDVIRERYGGETYPIVGQPQTYPQVPKGQLVHGNELFPGNEPPKTTNLSAIPGWDGGKALKAHMQALADPGEMPPPIEHVFDALPPHVQDYINGMGPKPDAPGMSMAKWYNSLFEPGGPYYGSAGAYNYPGETPF